MDRFSKEQRSKIMSKICSKDTNPEKQVRKALWAKGFRYRIHDKSIIGTPDVSNKSKKIAIFVDGCFWHGCKRCYVPPKTNSDYWKNKYQKNKERRKKVVKALTKEDWKIIQIWEHELKINPHKILVKIASLW